MVHHKKGFCIKVKKIMYQYHGSLGKPSNFSNGRSFRRMLFNSIDVEIYNRDAKSRLFPIHCYRDSKSLLGSVFSAKTLKEKRLKVNVCLINEIIEKRFNPLIGTLATDSWLIV